VPYTAPNFESCIGGIRKGISGWGISNRSNSLVSDNYLGRSAKIVDVDQSIVAICFMGDISHQYSCIFLTNLQNYCWVFRTNVTSDSGIVTSHSI
jgi:hypothetical protein